MVNSKFKVGEIYKGTSGVGEVAITIVRRTQKSVWIDTCMDKNKRLKINTSCFNDNHEEIIYYRSWCAGSAKTYSQEAQASDSLYAAYHR